MGDDGAIALEELGDSVAAEVDEEDFEAQVGNDEKRPWSELEDFEWENIIPDFFTAFLGLSKYQDVLLGPVKVALFLIIWFSWWLLDFKLGLFLNLREDSNGSIDEESPSSVGESIGMPGFSSHLNGTLPGDLKLYDSLFRGGENCSSEDDDLLERSLFTKTSFPWSTESWFTIFAVTISQGKQ